MATLAVSGENTMEYPEAVHIAYGAPKGDNTFNAPNLTVHDFNMAETIFSQIEQNLQESIGFLTERQMRHKSETPKLFLRHLAAADRINSFVLRINWSAFSRSPYRIQMAQIIADVLHQNLEPDREVDLSEMKNKGIGYSDYKL